MKNDKILLTGGSGFLGTYVLKELLKNGFVKNSIFIPRSKQFDLRKRNICRKVTKGVDIVVHLAANGGGIGKNRELPGILFYDNAIIGIELMEAARVNGVKKFVTIGTVCEYPKFTPVPFKEKDLWSGFPEETNAPYGLAKKMLLVQGQAYRQQYGMNVIHLLLVNLYGPGDNFDPSSSHVIPAIIQKVVDAMRAGKKEIVIWGTGKASREFIYVEDAAYAIRLAINTYNGYDPINIGTGVDITIKDLVSLICQEMRFAGRVVWDTAKPDGQPQRRLDTTRAKNELKFVARTPFRRGLRKTISWFFQNKP